MSQDGYFKGSQVQSTAVECAIADFMALLRSTAEATDNDEYDVRVGIAWSGEEPLTFLRVDGIGHAYEGVPLHTYTPVEATVNATEDPHAFHGRVYDLALDCVNQGGISYLEMVRRPPGQDS